MYSDRRSSTGKLLGALLIVGALAGLLVYKGVELAKRRRIEAQIQEISQKRDELSKQLENQQQRLTAFNRQLDNQNAELNEFKANIQGYILDHKMAVSAIVLGVGGSKAAIDSDNVFTQDTKNAGAVTAVIAGAWALFHLGEISDVVKVLNEANATVHTKETAIQGTMSAIQETKTSIEATQSQLEENTRQTEEMQKELDK